MGKLMAKPYRPTSVILGEYKANCHATRLAVAGQFPIGRQSIPEIVSEWGKH